MPHPSLRPRRISVAVTTVAMTLGAATLMPSAAHASGAPANDDLANAQVISGAAGSAVATGTNVGATIQPGESLPNAWTPHNTTWFSWTAPATGPVLFDLNGSAPDTVEAVYTLSGKGLVPAGFDDDYDGHVASAVPVAAIAGTTYYVQVGSFSDGDTGALQLAINPITHGIQGLVKTSAGAPVPGACVTAENSLGSTSVTNAAGQYVITDSAASDIPSVSNCFGDANLTQSASAPSPTTVGTGLATSAPIVVTPGASLTGRVIDQNGAPVAGANVEVWASGSSDVTTVTDAAGHYTTSGLKAGSYSVAAWDSANSLYNHTLASPVTVPSSGTTTAPDVSVQVLAGASGHVTKADGSDYASACITFTTGSTSTNVTADSAGNYSTQLPAGTYTVSFNDNCVSPLTSIWYNGAHSAATATPVILRSGVELSGVSGDFQSGGTAVAPATPNVNSSPFVSPVCVADRSAATFAAGAVSSPQAAVAAANTAVATANATIVRDRVALKKLLKRVKVAKRKHAKRAIKMLTKKVKRLRVKLRNDNAALAAATNAASSTSAAMAAAQAAAASASAAVGSAC